MPYLPAEAADLLRALVVEVRELRRMLEADRAGVASGADSALIAAVYAVAGHRECSARELIDMAQRPGLPEAALRALLGDRSVKAVGKLLAAAAGRPCASTGLVLLQRPGRSGATWRIQHAHKAAGN